MQAVEKMVAKETPTVMPHRFQVAQSVRNIWRIHAENGHTRAHIEQPEYWSHIARRLTPGDIIEVLAENGAFYGQVLVRVSDKLWAKVAVLSWHEFDSQSVDSKKLEVTWKGPVNKHCVVRVSDGEIIEKGFQTKDEAAAWVEKNRGSLE